MAQLCLGTVQFGMKYGINNTLGQPSEEQVFEMIDTAIDGGIRIIDTARAYGTAELLLGNYFKNRKNCDSLQIISKLRPNVIDETTKDVDSIIRRELEDSLTRLHVSQLDGYLLHTPQYIYNSQILSGLQHLKTERLVHHIGVSIYGLQEGYAALDTGIIDYIQLPYSIFDQRGIQEGFIQKAKEQGVTIFTRSAFLQGLFMMDTHRIPIHLKHAVPCLLTFEKLLKKYNVKKTDALIHFVNHESNIDYLVFGVDTNAQLQQDLHSFQNPDIPQAFIAEAKSTFVNMNKSIIFPSLWADGKKAE
ncbi:MAG: aldo/keto reductase [Lachnospiraceae bacterium]|nr:aldo/keto reductase [Lachnospiraceae bacterium]